MLEHSKLTINILVIVIKWIILEAVEKAAGASRFVIPAKAGMTKAMDAGSNPA